MKNLKAPQSILSALEQKGTEIHEFEKFGQKKQGTLRDALVAALSSKLVPDKNVEKRANEMLQKLERCGFPINFVMKGEHYNPKLKILSLEWGTDGRNLDVHTKDGKKYSLDLTMEDKELKNKIREIDFFDSRKGLVALKEELSDDKEILEKLCDNEILIEVREFLNLPTSFSSRKSDWEKVQGHKKEVVASLESNKNKARIESMLPDGETEETVLDSPYRGTALQNLIFIEYYRITGLGNKMNEDEKSKKEVLPKKGGNDNEKTPPQIRMPKKHLLA